MNNFDQFLNESNLNNEADVIKYLDSVLKINGMIVEPKDPRNLEIRKDLILGGVQAVIRTKFKNYSDGEYVYFSRKWYWNNLSEETVKDIEQKDPNYFKFFNKHYGSK